MPKVNSILKQRGFVALWAGQTISSLGSQLSGIAFPVFAIASLHANEFQMGSLNTANTLSFLAVGLIAGAWVDRWIKRQVMIIADLIRLIAIAMIPLLWFGGVLQFWHLLVIASVLGLATVFFDVAYQSYLPILLDKEHIGTGNARLETTSQITNVASPGIVGQIIAVTSAPFVIILDAISFGVSAISLMAIKDREVLKPKSDRRPLRTEIAEGLRFVGSQRLIRAISANTAVGNFFTTMATTMIPLLLLRDLKMPVSLYGLAFSMAAVGGLVGAALTPRLIKLIGEGQLIVSSSILLAFAGLSQLLLFVVPAQFAAAVMIPAEFLISFTVLTYNITQVTARQRLCPEHLLGRMNASIRFMVWGVMPIGAYLSGLLGAAFGIAVPIFVGFIGALFAPLFTLFSPLRSMREMPKTEAEGAAL